MRVAVIGAGVVGVTTAYELAADGHAVSVYERHATVASGTSYANAGVLAPGYVTPWAAPGMAWKVISHLFSSHAPVRFTLASLFTHLPWLWRWQRACRPAVYQANRAAMLHLARYSSERRHALDAPHAMDYEQRRGLLVLLRSERELRRAHINLAALRALGVNAALLDRAAAFAVEPGLNLATPLAGALHLPDDELGNCRQFTHLIKARAQALGASFLFQHEVHQIEPGAQPLVHGTALNNGRPSASTARFDAVVVCAGHQANALLAPLGQRLPLVPVYGYSLTAPLRVDERHPALGPHAALMDERYKVAITRLGARIRVAGSAELGGHLDWHNPAALRTLYKVLDDWFPGAAQLNQAQAWKGARPMLPDGPPIIGAARAPGVWLNLGHGSSGWALACGSARAMADLLIQRQPQIDLTRLSPQRLGA